MNAFYFNNIYIAVSAKHCKGVKRNCTDCQREFTAPVQNKFCEMPDGSFVTRADYIDTCPICDDDFYGLSWNLYFMDDLVEYRPLYRYVEPYTVDL